MIVTTEMREALNRTVEEWAEKYKNQNVKRLRRKEASSRLTESLRYNIDRQADDEVSGLLFYFQTHGRFLDMKRVHYAKGGEDYIDGLVEWMTNKGIVNDLIADWWTRNTNRQIPPDIERRIAWGIIKTRLKKQKQWKWYNKSKQAALNELNTRVLLAMTQPMLTDISAILAPQSSKFSRGYNRARGR